MFTVGGHRQVRRGCFQKKQGYKEWSGTWEDQKSPTIVLCVYIHVSMHDVYLSGNSLQNGVVYVGRSEVGCLFRNIVLCACIQEWNGT